MAANSKINGVIVDVFNDVNQAYIEVTVSRSFVNGDKIYYKERAYCYKSAVIRGTNLAVILSNKRRPVALPV
jgi:rRNA processing protein Gar1